MGVPSLEAAGPAQEMPAVRGSPVVTAQAVYWRA